MGPGRAAGRGWPAAVDVTPGGNCPLGLLVPDRLAGATIRAIRRAGRPTSARGPGGACSTSPLGFWCRIVPQMRSRARSPRRAVGEMADADDRALVERRIIP